VTPITEGGGVFPVERQRWLVTRARSEGRVDVGDAAGQLGVAAETIRRDLHDLEKRGLLKRVHGGALPVEGAAFERPLADRHSRGMTQEKSRIATHVVELLAEADSVYLDEGSTAQCVAEVLEPTHPLTVVTAALPTATIVAQRPNVRLVVLGGRVRPTSLAAADSWVVTMLRSLVIDVAVIGSNGVTLEHGCTCPDQAVAEAKAQAIKSSRQRILACDNSKFGMDSFIKFASIEDFTHVVGDSGVSADLASAIHSRGPLVTLV
jgi:DeoR family transcriptional regulator, fructose operon transcriptional repressor